MLGIADSVHYDLASRVCLRRLDQKLLEFARALFIAPIADPKHVSRLFPLQRIEALHVGCLVEGPHISDAEAVSIDLADGLTKCQNTVEEIQMESQDLAGVGVCAMMSVMEQGA